MHSQMDEIARSIRAAIEGMTDQQMLVHPDGKWSSAQILEHLALTYTTTATKLEKTAECDEIRLKPDSARNIVRRFVVTGLHFIPGGRKAPSFAEPGNLSPALVRKQIFQALGQMDAAIAGCEEKHGGKKHIADHPVLGRCTTAQWRSFHLAHTRHHMKQIARLRKAGSMEQKPAPGKSAKKKAAAKP